MTEHQAKIAPPMKQDAIKTFVALRDALTTERNSIQHRLAQINRVLEVGNAPPAAPVPVEETWRGRRAGHKRRMSAATRKKLAESQRLRRARERGEISTPTTIESNGSPKPGRRKKRVMSSQAKAKIAAAKRKWWAARKKAGK